MSLIYPEITPTNIFTNILLIDSTVIDYHQFVNSANSTTFPIVYSANSSKTELLTLLQTNFTSIKRIGMCFTYIGTSSQIFLDSEFFFSNNEVEPYSENLQFIINIINQFGVTNLDYLACNTMIDPSWVNYYKILTDATGVIVGASNDQTGNIKYGGDWIMESTSQDIEFVYFTSSIEYYKYLLDITSSTIIIKNDGTVWGTGQNTLGQLGLNDYNNRSTLTQISIPIGKTVASMVGATYDTFALMTDGTVWGTGKNTGGELSVGDYNNRSTLTLMSIPIGKTVASVSCNDHIIAFMTDGTVWGNGYNRNGQLGLSDKINRNQFTQMLTTIDKTVASVSCGVGTTIALMTDGTVWGTGANISGTLGLNDITNRIQFTQMINNTGKTVASVSCGSDHTILLMTDGSVWGTGSNSNGELGLGDYNNRSTLTLMINTTGKTVTSVSCGSFHTILLMTDGSVWGTGFNGYGVLGIGLNDYANRNTLTQMLNTTGKIIAAVSCKHLYTMTLMTDGSVWGTGNNFYGQLGTNNTTNSDILTPMLYGTNVKQILTNNSRLTPNLTPPPPPPTPTPPCFLEGSKILCLQNNREIYIPIQNLRKGVLVKTTRSGYLPIHMIGYSRIYSPTQPKNSLYKCSKKNYPKLTEDLIITGSHAILVDSITDLKREQIINTFGKIYITDKKYRLMACLDDRAELYHQEGTFTIYHLALEDPDPKINFGIYANGLLVESCSQIYLKEKSNMTLL